MKAEVAVSGHAARTLLVHEGELPTPLASRFSS